MQPIKYRAWLKEEKKLGYVTKLQWLMLDSQQPEELTFEAVEVRIGLSIYIVFPDEVELMQQTGLKDKNGVEIAEGDIVRGFGTNGVVEYFDNLNWDSGGSLHAGFYCQQWFEYKEEGALSYHYGFSDCEIIGNVHENEELLK